jgi:hypothetical protein
MLAVLLISITKVYKLSKAFVDRDEVKADEWIKAESEMRSQLDNKLPRGLSQGSQRACGKPPFRGKECIEYRGHLLKSTGVNRRRTRRVSRLACWAPRRAIDSTIPS